MRKSTKLTKKDLKNYHKLLDSILKTDNLYTIRSLVESYIKHGNAYPTYSSDNNRTSGDCNGDGVINVLDIVMLVNYIIEPPDEPDETILQNCDFNGDGIINVVDIVQLINIILNPDEPDEWTDEDIWNRVIFLQSEGDETWESFNSTRYQEVHELSYPGGYVLEEGNGEGVVLITAPHAQACYRPTKWNTYNDPSSGLKYCDDPDDTLCYKPDDVCSGAMAKTLAELNGATVLYTRGRQQDPNYYQWLTGDDRGHTAAENIDSGNVADPEMGYYEYGGIQTGAFYEDLQSGMRHPFKEQLFEYLTTHPEIKLVIDLHGASSSLNRWDVDLGLLGDNGDWGINTQDNSADWMDDLCIGSWDEEDCPGGGWSGTPTLEYDFLMEMMNIFYDGEIGRCQYECVSNNGYQDCAHLSPHCPDGIRGHGPVSFNDFRAFTDGSVTKFVNQYFGDSVQAVQLEISSFYRCSSSDDSNSEDVVKFMRVLDEIVKSANTYYSNDRFNGNDSSDNWIKGYRHA